MTNLQFPEGTRMVSSFTFYLWQSVYNSIIDGEAMSNRTPLHELIAIAEPALCHEPPKMPPHLLALAREVGAEELLQPLQMKNGFYALARTLHFF